MTGTLADLVLSNGGLGTGNGQRVAVEAAPRPPRYELPDAGEFVRILGRAGRPGVIAVGGRMVDGQDQVVALGDAGLGSALKSPPSLNERPGCAHAVIDQRLQVLVPRIELFHPAHGQRFPVAARVVGVGAGAFEHVVALQVAVPARRVAGGGLRAGVLEVEAAHRETAGAAPPHGVPLLDAVVFFRSGTTAKTDRLRIGGIDMFSTPMAIYSWQRRYNVALNSASSVFSATSGCPSA